MLFICLTSVIIYMKKFLDSDWLGAVQFKCNTSAEICNTSAKICNTDANYFWIWSFKSELEIDFFLFCYLWTLETSNLRIFHSFRNTFVWKNGKKLEDFSCRLNKIVDEVRALLTPSDLNERALKIVFSKFLFEFFHVYY